MNSIKVLLQKSREKRIQKILNLPNLGWLEIGWVKRLLAVIAVVSSWTFLFTLFFDDFNELGFEKSFAMTRAVGDAFINAYLPIVERRYQDAFTPEEKSFQEYRRGRYVEYNLLFDRGTIFGLHSGGRTESILMSMPPVVQWWYNWQPQPGTPEAKLYDYYLKPRDWLA